MWCKGVGLNELLGHWPGGIEMQAIGAVLTITSRGHTRACGQAIGANGCGDYAFVIEGTPEDAETWAINKVREMERAGHRIESVVIARSDTMLYHGDALQFVRLNG
jgi:hypothetical protein